MSTAATTAIEVAELEHAYHGSPVLHRVSFRIEQGERVGLVGPNGAGKSTLLLRLLGLLDGAGQVVVAGRRLDKASLGWIRSRAGLVFADAEDQLFMPTLVEDAAFGPLNLGLDRERARARAEAALAQMGLDGLGDRSPHHLSDGERRRAALAAVLAMEPEVWLLDEPAANLDPRGRRELIALLGGLDGSLLLASHDLDMVLQVCERCLVLDRGRLVADGPAAGILGDAGLMERHGLEVPLRLELERRR